MDTLQIQVQGTQLQSSHKYCKTWYAFDESKSDVKATLSLPTS